MTNLNEKYKNVTNKSVITCYGQTIHLNHHIDHIGYSITISKAFYEMQMLDYINKNIPKGGTYIDVGANIGNHSVFFSRFCADNVISIEPIIENCDKFEKNITDNGIKNCILYKKGLSKNGRSLGSKIIPLNMGSCTLVEGGKGVETITVDELKVNEIKLIKIDCEDMSMEVFMCLLPLIKKYKPHLFIEATKPELSIIEKLTGYKKIQRFNATPTYYMKP